MSKQFVAWHRRTLMAALLAVCAASPPAAWAQTRLAGCPGDEPGFSDFDFWVGEWDVYAGANGALAGVNTIEKIEAGCLLLERWQGLRGSTGLSMNHFDPNAGHWRQVWVSSGAYAIDIVGGLRDDSMVLEGTISYFGRRVTLPFRGTWTPLPDGAVRQFFEQQNASGEWQPWFDGRYVRRAVDR